LRLISSKRGSVMVFADSSGFFYFFGAEQTFQAEKAFCRDSDPQSISSTPGGWCIDRTTDRQGRNHF